MHGILWQDYSFVSQLSLFLILSVCRDHLRYLLNLLVYLHSLVISLRVVIQSVSQSI